MLTESQSKKYFDRPLDHKMKQTLSDAETNQGYTPDGAEANGGTDHKEVCLSWDEHSVGIALTPHTLVLRA